MKKGNRADKRREKNLIPSDKPKQNPVKKTEMPEDGIRLNKFLSNAGIASRRKADELIANGKVKVNNEVVREMGFKVMPDDNVFFDGKKVELKQHVYILLNKPKNYITTVSDEKGRKTVLDLVKNATQERIFPVGRLDRSTTGVLMLTNDGDLTNKLTHPSRKVEKVYVATLDKPLIKKDLDAILGGFSLEDGPVMVDAIAFPEENNKTRVGIEIHEGRNHIVRRIFQHFGYTVEKLDRVLFAGLTKKNVERGKWRYLTEKEVIRLKHFSK